MALSFLIAIIHKHGFSCRKYYAILNIMEQARFLYKENPVGITEYLVFPFLIVRKS